MVAISDIEKLSRRMANELGAEKVILFGSYAHGRATENSDIDLLVVADIDLPPPEQYVAVRRLASDIPASFDIVVRSPSEYARWKSVINNIVYFADKYGKVLYERAGNSVG